MKNNRIILISRRLKVNTGVRFSARVIVTDRKSKRRLFIEPLLDKNLTFLGVIIIQAKRRYSAGDVVEGK
jgi:hypothetical protein